MYFLLKAKKRILTPIVKVNNGLERLNVKIEIKIAKNEATIHELDEQIKELNRDNTVLAGVARHNTMLQEKLSQVLPKEVIL